MALQDDERETKIERMKEEERTRKGGKEESRKRDWDGN